MRKLSYAKNKGADQAAHPRSLISTFAVRFLDMYTSYIQGFKILASWAGGFESYLFENPWRHVFAWCGSMKDRTILFYKIFRILFQRKVIITEPSLIYFKCVYMYL